MLNTNYFLIFAVPVLIVLALSVVLSFCLAFLSEKLKPKQDERLEKVRENLPGVNCGGCGYPGCDAFAEALIKGEARAEDCKPSSKTAKQTIAALLGMQLENPSQPKVAAVYCNGGIEAVDKASYSGYADCQNANTVSKGTKECDAGCMGLGSCVKACNYGAISIDKVRNIAIVNPIKCVKCGMCYASCPKKIISDIPVLAKVYVACSNRCVAKKANAVCKRSCIACSLCVKKCPTGAIKIVENLAVINHEKCIGCGECVNVCPHKCILKHD